MKLVITNSFNTLESNKLHYSSPPRGLLMLDLDLRFTKCINKNCRFKIYMHKTVTKSSSLRIMDCP